MAAPTRVGGSTVHVVTTASTGSPSIYTASSDFTVTGGTTNCLVVFVGISMNAAFTDTECSVTAEGVAMNAGARKAHAGGGGRPYGGLFYLMNPAAGATTIVTATGAVAGRAAVIHCEEWSGVDPADPLGAVVATQGSGSSSAYAINIVPEAAGNIVISALACADGDASPFASVNGTERTDQTTGTTSTSDIAGWVNSYPTVGTSSVNVGATGSLTATDTVFLAIELRAAPSAYTIAADAGSYALTGTAATLKYGRLVAASAGSYALTGTAATLKYGRLVAADAGSYAVTGTDASLEYGRLLAAGAGAYTLTGQSATLTKAGVGYTLAASAGSYALSGQAATFLRSYILAAEPGAYTLTGTAATLRYGEPEPEPVPVSRIGGGGGGRRWEWSKKRREDWERFTLRLIRRMNGEPEDIEEAIAVVAPHVPREVDPRAIQAVIRALLPEAPIAEIKAAVVQIVEKPEFDPAVIDEDFVMFVSRQYHERQN
jgi:hypothetical protein